MARSRNIKPGFFKNEVLAEMKPHVRLLFVGLWTLADREGRLEDRVPRIKAELFPYEAVPVDRWLNELQAKKFLSRYESNGCKCIQILNFKKHQNPHKKEAASLLPPPVAEAPAPVPAIPVQAPEIPARAGLIPDSLLLIPDSLIPHTDIPADPGIDTKAVFEEVWEFYPNKDGKEAAFRHFKRTVRTEADVGRLKKALQNYLGSRRVRQGFVKNGSTWFNGWRDWENYTETQDAEGQRTDGGSSSGGGRETFTNDTIRRLIKHPARSASG